METKQAEMMARDLMAHHGLTEKGWSFEFDQAKTRMGVTKQREMVIGLSEPNTLVNGADSVLNTILHEIAHALVGVNQGHGYTWYLKAKEIGCSGERCSSSAQAPGKYALKCKGCAREVKQCYRKPTERKLQYAFHSICGAVNGKLELVVKGA